jgi:plastocyanin
MSIVRSIATTLVVCAASATIAPLAAQLAEAPVLPIGRTLDGTLGRTDPTLNERGRFRIFRLDVKAGQRYSVVMRADDFDSYLSIARQVNGLTDYLASDDDGAGNSNARLKWVPKAAGTYYVVAQSLKDDGLGNFTVRLDTLPAVIIKPPVAVTLGETYTGELADTDPAVDDKGAYYDLYRITARKGQKLIIEMKGAGDLDAFVGIGTMMGDTVHIDETDDDGGGEKNARLRYTVKEDGTFIIRAQALESNATGSYTLKVSERTARPATIINMVANTPTTGELTDSDDEADDGSLFDLYRITVRAGETITVTMRSSAVDSYVVLGQMVDGEWNQVAYDDDSAGGNNARLTHTFDAAGEYLIRANTVGAGKTGSYTIRMERTGAGAPVRRRPADSDDAAAATKTGPVVEMRPPASPRRRP